MKKIGLIFASILVVALLLSPIVGGSMTRSIVEKRIQALQHAGIKVVEHNSSKHYLSTEQHFLFQASDPALLRQYLETVGIETLPFYMQTLLDGTEVGIDITYSNVPFMKNILLSIYPVALSSSLYVPLHEYDETLAHSLEKFVASKALRLDVSYDLYNSTFEGEMKDIDYRFKQKENGFIDLKMHDMHVKGLGAIEAPKNISYQIQSLHVNGTNQGKPLDLALESFNFSTAFTQGVTTDMLSCNEMRLSTKGSEPARVVVKGIQTTYIREDEDNSTNVLYKTNVLALDVEVNALHYHFDEIIANVKFDGLSKKALALLTTNSDAQASVQQQQKVNALMLLFTQGFGVDIETVEVASITLPDMQTRQKTTLQGNVVFYPDQQVLQSLMQPQRMLSHLALDMNISIDKTLYLQKMKTTLQSFDALKRSCKNGYCFDVNIDKGVVRINGQTL